MVSIQNTPNERPNMNRIQIVNIIVFTIMLFLPIKAYASLLKVNPQVDKADLYLGKYTVAWKVPIQITDAVFAGLKIQIEFSTADVARNESIISLGSGYDQGRKMDYGIVLKENGSQIDMVRRVEVKGVVKPHTCPSWNDALLERSKNYILTIEIDETRFRYSVYESGNPSTIKYEYQYDGLRPTYVRRQMVKNGIYVAVNRYHYLVQSLEVTELGYGVGVKPIIPDPYSMHGRIKNVNSGFYLSRKGSTYPSDYLQQKSSTVNANELWKITTERQSDRSINSYNTIVTSEYKDTYIGPRYCSTEDGAYIYEMTSSDCNKWTIESNGQMRPEVYIKNMHSSGYLTTQYSSKSDGAYIYQQLKPQIGSKWKIEEVKYDTSLKDGFYTIVNSRSDLYMMVYGKGRWTPGYIIQADEDYSDANAWYVSKQPEGTYLIRNLDTNGYLSVYGSYFDYGVYIVQSYTIGGASERWVAKKIQERIYYLTSLCSGMNIGMRYDSKEPGEYVIQTNSTDLSYQWVFFPEDFSVGEKLHGFYKIQDMTTSKYLGVEGYTTSKDANIVAQDNADDPAGWWSIEQVEGGPYILKNVNSQFCVAVENRSSQNGAHLVQTSVPERMRGHCFWRMIKTDGGFYFRNVFDGMFLTIKDGYFVIQKVPVHGSGHPDTNMSWRLIPVEYGVSN